MHGQIMMPTMVKEHKRQKRNTTVGRITFELYKSTKPTHRNTIPLNNSSSINLGSVSPRASQMGLKQSSKRKFKKENIEY